MMRGGSFKSRECANEKFPAGVKQDQRRVVQIDKSEETVVLKQQQPNVPSPTSRIFSPNPYGIVPLLLSLSSLARFPFPGSAPSAKASPSGFSVPTSAAASSAARSLPFSSARSAFRCFFSCDCVAPAVAAFARSSLASAAILAFARRDAFHCELTRAARPAIPSVLSYFPKKKQKKKCSRMEATWM